MSRQQTSVKDIAGTGAERQLTLSADGVLEERDSWLLDQLEAAALFASLNQATDF
ncbi:hypothetical protein Ac2012v2_005682, partial [Leucoagaricus gongylophorus]